MVQALVGIWHLILLKPYWVWCPIKKVVSCVVYYKESCIMVQVLQLVCFGIPSYKNLEVAYDVDFTIAMESIVPFIW